MRLGRRILDLVKAVALAAPRNLMAGVKTAPGRGDADAERIERALARAEERRRRLEENLADAGRVGREGDARLAQRQLAELERSTEGLRQALELVEARREAARHASTGPAPGSHTGPLDAAQAQPPAEPAEPGVDPDLEARKRRLSGPK